MKEIKVVIGKNFGDEGKGAAVHFLAKEKGTVVVRHNGGGQSGHTVEEGNFRFIFHQLGSGSLKGCPTYWSKTFLPDLLKLGEEIAAFKEALQNAGREKDEPLAALYQKDFKVYASPDCACVTIYDVLLNSLKETLRGENKHGSCGMGIYETVLRTKEPVYALYLRDFWGLTYGEVVRRLQRIQRGYAIPRLKELQAEYPEDFDREEICFWAEMMESEEVLRNAACDMHENFNRNVVFMDFESLFSKMDTVIFENGQGLLLDWDNEEYAPHLTASHTGLTNITKLLGEMDQELIKDCSLDVYYITRSYVTRHGAGRLDEECFKEDINPFMVDRTNIPNVWQDTLRYARHPVGEDFFRYIKKDLENLKDGILSSKVHILLTHMDETAGKVLFADGDKTYKELSLIHI